MMNRVEAHRCLGGQGNRALAPRRGGFAHWQDEEVTLVGCALLDCQEYDEFRPLK